MLSNYYKMRLVITVMYATKRTFRYATSQKFISPIDNYGIALVITNYVLIYLEITLTGSQLI